jgi:radical SAM superfamily enzyme YgiQ (UPF0313 family)
MKVLYAHKHHPIEPLGVGYLASSIARGGHESKLVLTSRNMDEAVEQVSNKINEYGIDVFAQSIIFGSHGYAIELNKKIKERHPRVIGFLGGPAPTFTSELLSRGFDAICRYEGEQPFLEFLNALENGDDVGGIPNIWVNENPDLYHTDVKKVKSNLDIDGQAYREESGYDPERKRFVNNTRNLLQGDALTSLPSPDREVLYDIEMYKDGPIKHFMHTRGCVHRCSYCHVHIMNAEMKGKGKVLRTRGNEAMAEEVENVIRKYGAELIYWQDDILGPSYSASKAKEFAEIFAHIGKPMHGHARFDHIAREPDIAKYLAKAGVTGLHVAIEAGNDKIRNGIHRRDMSEKQILEGSKILRDNGINMMTQNILGAPGETKEQMIETLELNIAVKPTFASASIFQPYPGTSALENARDLGILPTENQDELIDTFGLETFYNKSILVQDPEENRWLELFQKFFAIAVQNPQIHESGVLERTIQNYPRGEVIDKELENMYRSHRAIADEELYGVKLEEIVMEEN